MKTGVSSTKSLIGTTIVGLLLLTGCSNNSEETPALPNPAPVTSPDPATSPSPSVPETEDDGEFKLVTHTVSGFSFELPSSWKEYDSTIFPDPNGELFGGVPAKVYIRYDKQVDDSFIFQHKDILIVREVSLSEEAVNYMKTVELDPKTAPLNFIFNESFDHSIEKDNFNVSANKHSEDPGLLRGYGTRNSEGSGIDFAIARHSDYKRLTNLPEDALEEIEKDLIFDVENNMLNTLKLVDDTRVNNSTYELPTRERFDIKKHLESFPDFEPKTYGHGATNPSDTSSELIPVEGAGYIVFNPSNKLQSAMPSGKDPLAGSHYNRLGETFSKRPAFLFNLEKNESEHAPYVYVNSVWDGWGATVYPARDLPILNDGFTTNTTGTYVFGHDGSATLIKYDTEKILNNIFGYNKNGKQIKLSNSSDTIIIPEGTTYIVIETESDTLTNYTVTPFVDIEYLDASKLEPNTYYRMKTPVKGWNITPPEGKDLITVDLEESTTVRRSSESSEYAPFIAPSKDFVILYR